MRSHMLISSIGVTIAPATSPTMLTNIITSVANATGNAIRVMNPSPNLASIDMKLFIVTASPDEVRRAV